MRRRGVRLSVVLAALLLAMTVPSASAGATRTDFVGFVFPAGYLDAGASCVAAGGDYGNGLLPTCVLEEGTTTSLGGGRWLIRNELVVDISYAWHSFADIVSYPLAPNEPRRTGYVREYFNANLDASLSGPVWGSWEFYSFGHRGADVHRALQRTAGSGPVHHPGQWDRRRGFPEPTRLAGCRARVREHVRPVPRTRLRLSQPLAARRGGGHARLDAPGADQVRPARQ